MKNLLTVLALLTAFAVLPSPRLAAQDSGIGVGIIVGEPTGLSFKYWLGSGSAVDAGVAWSLEGRSSFSIHGDYLRHFDLIQVEEGHLPFYAGLGARMRFLEDRPNNEDSDNFRLGVRIPLGIAYLFENIPLELFLEVVPVLDLISSTEFDMNFGVGGRWYF